MLNQEEQEKARKIQSDLARQLKRHRADTNLSGTGCDRAMAQAILAARAEMSKMREASDKRAKAEEQKAYRAAFGMSKIDPAGDRAYRDSLASSAPDHAAAGRMLSAAIARGDTTAVIALTEYALARRNGELDGPAWYAVIGQAAASSPVLDAQLVPLRDATEPGKAARFADRLVTQIPQPRDLHGNLDVLARSGT